MTYYDVQGGLMISLDALRFLKTTYDVLVSPMKTYDEWFDLISIKDMVNDVSLFSLMTWWMMNPHFY